MENNSELSYELCRTLLRRSAWRIQYKIRTQQYKEGFSIFDYQGHCSCFDDEVVSKIYIEELLETIPWKKSREVIQKVIIDQETEKEVAEELQISQQAVSKWKLKGLNLLRQNLKHS